jgi:hypothetical protein
MLSGRKVRIDKMERQLLPNRPRRLELARGDWITQHANVCLIGQPGTEKTHLSIALGLAPAVKAGVRSSSRPRRWSTNWKRLRRSAALINC